MPALEIRSTFIVGLLHIISPSAVVRRVVSAIVNAVDAHFIVGSPSHVSEEIFIRSKPTVTYGDTSLTPVFVISITSIVTSLLYITPSSVFNRNTRTPTVAMLNRFTDKTTARFCFTRNKRPSVGIADVTAVAKTIPSMVSVPVLSGMSEDFKVSVTIACNILKISFLDLLNIITTARFSRSRGEFVAVNNPFIPTFTGALPPSLSLRVSAGKRNYGKVCKSFPSKVGSKFSHFFNLLCSDLSLSERLVMYKRALP